MLNLYLKLSLTSSKNKFQQKQLALYKSYASAQSGNPDQSGTFSCLHWATALPSCISNVFTNCCGYSSLVLCVYWICLFVWFFVSWSTVFQSCRDGSFWVEPVLSSDHCALLKNTMQCRRLVSNTQPLDLESSTLPLSHWPFLLMYLKVKIGHKSR